MRALLFLHELKKDKDLSAINFYHDKVQTSNELFYARKLCKQLNVPLQEVNASDHVASSFRKNKNGRLKPNKPSTALLSSSESDAIITLLNQEAPAIFINGHGGDHIFMCPPT